MEICDTKVLHACQLPHSRCLKLEGAKPKEAVGLELALKDGADGGGQLQKAEYKGYRAEGPSPGKAKQLGRLTIH